MFHRTYIRVIRPQAIDLTWLQDLFENKTSYRVIIDFRSHAQAIILHGRDLRVLGM